MQSKGTKRKAQADNDLQCKMCEIAKPRAAYAQTRLKDYHKQKGELWCMVCEERVAALRSCVNRTKHYCKCTKNIHDEKCPMYRYAARKIWPGSDGKGRNKVSDSDVGFLNRLPRHPKFSWWYKKWNLTSWMKPP